MTTAMVIALPGVSIAGADTRISASHDLGVTAADGPTDFHLHVEALGRTLVLPFQQRKLQLVGNGWVSIAGDFFTAQRILALVQAEGAITFENARQVAMRGFPRVAEVLRNEFGFGDTQMRETLLLGAPLSATGDCWAMALDGSNTVPSAGLHAINWPHSVPDTAQVRATERLAQALRQAYDSGSFAGLIRATLQVLHEGSQYGPESGPLVQVGISSLSAALAGPKYVEGSVVELLGLGDTALMARLQPPPRPNYWSWLSVV